MNWLLVGVALLCIGIVFIAIGVRQARLEGGNPPSIIQTGYLLTVFGGFAIVAQYFSIGDTMLFFVLVTGVITLLDRLILRRRRKEGQREPGWVEFSRAFFPVLFVVFAIRGFVVEPYQIPSSSMRSGLIPGDFILVNKFNYGIRLPVTNKVAIAISSPKRGDVMVFNYPNNPRENFIKRVIGVPGDSVSYHNKHLSINGKPVPREEQDQLYQYIGDDGRLTVAQAARETLGGKSYQTLFEKDYPTVALAGVQEFAFRENCQYDETGFTCKVPDGHYFVMGDNRDRSGDSRYWGFVPDKYIVGRAFFIWMNFGHLSRIGTSIN